MGIETNYYIHTHINVDLGISMKDSFTLVYIFKIYNLLKQIVNIFVFGK